MKEQTSNRCYENNFVEFFKSNPLQVGNLFDSHWNQIFSGSIPTLRISLFEYYLRNGWTHPSNHSNFEKKYMDSNNFNLEPGTNNPFLKQVMLGAAARGDIKGMDYLFEITSNHSHHHQFYHILYHNFKDDTDVCTVAGAAGCLDALKWLLFEKKCKWEPEEVFREASENMHTDVMMFVENCCYKSSKNKYHDRVDGNENNSLKMNICMPYGEGMPW